jgi:alpha-tubulin suppressor-like RCC1 family protein
MIARVSNIDDSSGPVPRCKATAVGYGVAWLLLSQLVAAADTTPLLDATQVASGLFHTCARTSTGGVKCWGSNTIGQLGDGTTLDRLTAVDVPGLVSGVKAIAVGANHSCAVTDGGGVKCWGDNYSGQLGDGSTTDRMTPVDVQGLSGITAIAAGGSHTCALSLAGAVSCWGDNSSGELGDNSTIQRLTPVPVQGLGGGIGAIVGGGRHTCALSEGGGVRCWGFNGRGQLGDNSITTRLTPVDVQGLATGVSAITAGDEHSCALTQESGVKCWGFNSSGQLGDASNTNRPTPVNVQGLGGGIIAIAAGYDHTCALGAGGIVSCWGDNETGQLGDNTFTERFAPANVQGLGTGIVGVAAGAGHSCALSDEGRVKCWGDNSAGQLGDGSLPVRLTPVDVPGLAGGITTVAAGEFHGCAVTDTGGVKCWGRNDTGQLGDNTTMKRLVPVDVQGLGGVAAVGAGAEHSCALTQTGAVHCWGDNRIGQLGDGSTQGQLTPVGVQGLGSGVVAIAVGRYHSCALTQGGGVKCWGTNGSGQLGDNSLDYPAAPVDVVGLNTGVGSIAAGSSHTCAVTQGGGVKCWGANDDGQLGDNSTVDRLTPTDVTGLASGISTVAAGYEHTCARSQGGGVLCWGENFAGQLGNNSTEPSLTRVGVSELGSGVATIATGGRHSCARTLAGGLKCWGSNRVGQLGDGSDANRTAPVNVEGLSNGITNVATGRFHTCAVTSAGGVKCWGEHLYGQLGLGGRNYGLPSDVLVTRASAIFRNGFEP